MQNKEIDSKPIKSGLFSYDKEKEEILINSIGKINFKDLFMECLTPEFIKLFTENINLFYAKPFAEGISYEFGLFDKSKDIKKAYQIYKEGADFKYDYLCMYRMHRIFLIDYDDFGLEKNEDLHRLYLYKCFAYLPYLIIHEDFYLLLNKIDVLNELSIILEKLENNNFDTFDKFMDFLEINRNHFNITKNDIKLMKCVLRFYFSYKEIVNNIKTLEEFLDFEKGDNAYYEAQLKYCNFYLDFSQDKSEKDKIRNIFENLIKEKYYKACLDYGRFLIDEKKYDEAKNIFKLGSDNGQQFCMGEYFDLLLGTLDFNKILTDYNLSTYILKNMCIIIAFEKLGLSSFYYMLYYLIKHSSFKEKYQNEFNKYALEVFQTMKKYYINDESEKSIENIFAEKYALDIPFSLGLMYYYGIPNIINSDKEKALFYFKKAFKMAKEKEYNYKKRNNYIYIFKCRKYLFKDNKISLEKFNKTKDKLFKYFEDSKLDDLNVFELYNYYKLHKIGVHGNIQNKLIELLIKGKNYSIVYHFKTIVYREKCKIILEKEDSNKLSLLQNYKNSLKEKKDKNDIDLYFKTIDNHQYLLRVNKNIKFIDAIHELYNKYPELETINEGTYESNGNVINMDDTLLDNELEDNDIIIINS